MRIKTIFLFFLLLGISPIAYGGSKYYDGDNIPYEFSFKIEGNQHRQESKDSNGLITGEFGFVTADGVYHQTNYGTDENGNFRILSRKSYKLAPDQSQSPAKRESTPEKPSTEKPSNVQTCTNCETLNADILLSEDLVNEPKAEPKLKAEPKIEQPKVEITTTEKLITTPSPTTPSPTNPSQTTPSSTTPSPTTPSSTTPSPTTPSPTTHSPTTPSPTTPSPTTPSPTTPNPTTPTPTTPTPTTPTSTTPTPTTPSSAQTNTPNPVTTIKPNKNHHFTIPDIEILPPKETIHLKFPRPEQPESTSTTKRPSTTETTTTFKTTKKHIEIDDRRNILVGELPTENQLNSEDEPSVLSIKLPTSIESSAADKDTEITPPSTEPNQLPKLPENEIPTVAILNPTTTEKTSVEERNSRIISETSSTTTSAPADVIVKKLIPDSDQSLENPRPKAFIRSIESASSLKTTSPKPVPTSSQAPRAESAPTKEPQRDPITKGPKKTKPIPIPIIDLSPPDLLPVIEEPKISLPQILGLSPPALPEPPQTKTPAPIVVSTTSTSISTTPIISPTILTTEAPITSKSPIELFLDLSPPPIVPLIPIRDYSPPNYSVTESPQTQKPVVTESTTTTRVISTTPAITTVTMEAIAEIEKKLIENTLPLIVKDIFSIPIPKTDILDEAPPPPLERVAKQILSTPAPFSTPKPGSKRESGHRFNSTFINNVVAPSLEIADMLYKFNYTTGFHGHDEHGNSNGMKKGEYFIIGRDNIKRTVSYVASKNGFVPSVRFGLVKPEEAPNKDTERTDGVKNQEFKWFIENPKSKNLIR